jgi:hypothetical protein
MATAQELVDLLDTKLLGYRNSFDTTGDTGETKKLRAINAGQHKVWQLLVGASKEDRANWFGKSTSVIFGAGDRDQALPVDFHALLSVESSSVPMEASAFWKDTWQEERRKTGNVAPADIQVVHFVVSGDDQPILHISRLTTGLTVTVEYISTLPNITAVADNIDRIPIAFRDAVTNYAATVLTAATQDPAVAQIWAELWRNDQLLITGASDVRQMADLLSKSAIDIQR